MRLSAVCPLRLDLQRRRRSRTVRLCPGRTRRHRREEHIITGCVRTVMQISGPSTGDFSPVRQITAQGMQSETYMEHYERLLRQCEEQFQYQSDDPAELLAEAQEEMRLWEEEIETLNRAVEEEIGAARYLVYEASYYRWISQRDEKAALKAQGYTGAEYQWRIVMSQIESTKDRSGWIIRTYLN